MYIFPKVYGWIVLFSLVIQSKSSVLELTSSSTESGLVLAWQQLTAMLIKRFHHSRRDWKGLMAQILLPVLFVMIAMGLGSIKSDMQHYQKLELSPALYNIGPSNSFFRSVRTCGNYSNTVEKTQKQIRLIRAPD